MRLLLVEDDTMIGEAVRLGLRKQALAVDWVQDGLAAKAALSTETFDLVLLDLGLPKLDGLQVLKWLRGTGQVPVLILTARFGQ
jgi:DNA-binding response OmpR family regulator